MERSFSIYSGFGMSGSATTENLRVDGVSMSKEALCRILREDAAVLLHPAAAGLKHSALPQQKIEFNIRFVVEAVVWLATFRTQDWFWLRLRLVLGYPKNTEPILQDIVSSYCEGRKAYHREYQHIHGRLAPKGEHAPSPLVKAVDAIISMEAFGNSHHTSKEAAEHSWQSHVDSWRNSRSKEVRGDLIKPQFTTNIMAHQNPRRRLPLHFSDGAASSATLPSQANMRSSRPHVASSDEQLDELLHGRSPGHHSGTARSKSITNIATKNGISRYILPGVESTSYQSSANASKLNSKDNAALISPPGQIQSSSSAQSHSSQAPGNLITVKDHSPPLDFNNDAQRTGTPRCQNNSVSAGPSQMSLLPYPDQVGESTTAHHCLSRPGEPQHDQESSQTREVSNRWKTGATSGTQVVNLVSTDDENEGYRPTSARHRRKRQASPQGSTVCKRLRSNSIARDTLPEDTCTKLAVGAEIQETKQELDLADETGWPEPLDKSCSTPSSTNEPGTRTDDNTINSVNGGLDNISDNNDQAVEPVSLPGLDLHKLKARLGPLLSAYQTTNEAAVVASQSDQRSDQLECRLNKVEAQLQSLNQACNFMPQCNILTVSQPTSQPKLSETLKPGLSHQSEYFGSRYLQYTSADDVKPLLKGVSHEMNIMRSVIRHKIRQQDETAAGWKKMEHLSDVLWTLDEAIKKAKAGIEAL
ncbi:hypothetical protein BKA67DRAFT_547279 [Truncatella angustata]|uniref:Uncharacterized protein n=1 Tax=Truncatella angustata TaxID=152316 RepID=A0A9P8UXZ7_9PEZI|nr:uncharacterized protein BKA67DRAFT_547279 [Truncatella angustata]KAH6660210.1 hypothetical protein BKA67DRAFT_547279 [Truncatella angustata]KAH8199925.1 hypothetical protein TruAng_005921 [Truncatella angustata]